MRMHRSEAEKSEIACYNSRARARAARGSRANREGCGSSRTNYSQLTSLAAAIRIESWQPAGADPLPRTSAGDRFSKAEAITREE